MYNEVSRLLNLYFQICEFQSITDGWVTKVDPSMNEPYTYRLANMIWCGFENPESAAIKVLKNVIITSNVCAQSRLYL